MPLCETWAHDFSWDWGGPMAANIKSTQTELSK